MVVIITIDTGFREWESVFYYDKLTSVIVERLVYNHDLIVFIERSCRLKHSNIRG